MNTMVAMAQSKELTNHSLPGVGYVLAVATTPLSFAHETRLLSLKKYGEPY